MRLAIYKRKLRSAHTTVSFWLIHRAISSNLTSHFCSMPKATISGNSIYFVEGSKRCSVVNVTMWSRSIGFSHVAVFNSKRLGHTKFQHCFMYNLALKSNAWVISIPSQKLRHYHSFPSALSAARRRRREKAPTGPRVRLVPRYVTHVGYEHTYILKVEYYRKR